MRVGLIAAAVMVAGAVACGSRSSSQPSTTAAAMPASVDAPNPDAERAPAVPACMADQLTLGRHDPNALRSECLKTSQKMCMDQCDAGDAAACVELAYLLEASKAEPELIRRVYRHACRKGNHNACTNLGAWMYNQGHGPDDHACGVAMFEVTCATGEPFGCGMLAVALADGRGIEANASRAHDVAARACEDAGGFPCAVLGRLLSDAGRTTESQRAFRRACDTGYAQACGHNAPAAPGP